MIEKSDEEWFELALGTYMRTSESVRRRILRSLSRDDAKRLVAEAEKRMKETPPEKDKS